MARRTQRSSAGLEGLEENAAASHGFARKRKLPRDTLPASLTLVLVARLGWLYRLLGVEHAMLLQLVRTKWLLEDRRRRRSEGKGIASMQLLFLLAMYFLVGLLLGALAFAMLDQVSLYLSIVASMVFLMLMMPLLADLSVLLFDTSDVELMSSLPIDDRTLTAARVTMMLSYLGLLIAAIGFGPWLLGTIAFASIGYLLILPLALIQAGVLATALVLILFLSALKQLDLARFRDALVYIQGGALVFFLAAAQIGPRLLAEYDFFEWIEAHPGVRFAVPTMAPGALYGMCFGAPNPQHLGVLLAGVGLTLALVAFGSFLARDGVVSQLVQMESSGGRALEKPKGYGVAGFFGRRSRSSMMRAGWFFFLAQGSSDRTYKMRTMPVFSSIVIPIAGIFLIDMEGWRDVLPFLAFLPYILMVMPGSFWDQARFAESWEGAWIFDDLGDDEESQFVLGAMQALLARTILTPLIWFLVPLGLLLDLESLVGFLYAGSLALLAALWFLPRYGPSMPFIQRPSTRSAAPANFLLGCGSMLCMGILGGIQYGLLQLPVVIYVLTPLVSYFAWRMWRDFPKQHLHRRAGRKRRALLRKAGRL